MLVASSKHFPLPPATQQYNFCLVQTGVEDSWKKNQVLAIFSYQMRLLWLYTMLDTRQSRLPLLLVSYSKQLQTQACGHLIRIGSWSWCKKCWNRGERDQGASYSCNEAIHGAYTWESEEKTAMKQGKAKVQATKLFSPFKLVNAAYLTKLKKEQKAKIKWEVSEQKRG